MRIAAHRFCSAAALSLAVLAGTSAAPLFAADPPAAAPWDTPFAADTAAIRKASDALPVPEGKDVEILLRDQSWVLDASGRSTFRVRTVTRLLTEGGVTAWGQFVRTWAPWYQEKPVLRARVIGPNGKTVELDPRTIAEGPAGDESQDIYSDRRIVRAPFPSLSIGAVIEQEFTLRDTAPSFESGSTHTVPGFSKNPLRRLRFSVTAPVSLPLQYAVYGPGISMKDIHREEAGGMVHLTFDGGPSPEYVDWEPDTPPEDQHPASFAFSTGRSWHDVAARYSAIVDARIAAGGVETVLKDVDEKGKSGGTDVASLTARLHKQVRYTGVEFGDAAIVPAPPIETWKRGFGDCKDKAILLVALLRASGVPAHIALLDSGIGRDVDPTLPGLSSFDHAIVVVEPKGGKGRVWIDATDPYSPAGQLPEGDQGRMALIASDATRELVRIPKGDASANGLIETREFFLSEHGPARLVVTREFLGTRQSGMRASYHGASRKDAEKAVEELSSSLYLAKKLGKLDYPDPLDLSVPFRVRIELPEAGRGFTDENEASVAVLPEEWTAALSHLRPHDEGSDEEGTPEKAKHKARKRSFIWNEPFTNEWRYRVVPPEGYVAVGIPESSTRALGSISLSQEFKIEKNGAVTATIRLSSGKERLTATEFESVGVDVKRLEEQRPFLLRFESVAAQHLAAGRTREALTEYRRLASLHPKEALHHTQMALALLQVGLGESARRQAKLAVEAEPDSAPAENGLAWILQHDLIGRRFGKGFDRAGAIAAYRKAFALDPKDQDSRANFAILLEYDAAGRRYADPAQVKEAVTEYRAIRKDLNVKSYDANLAVALLRSGQFAEAEKFTAELPQGPQRNSVLLTAIAASKGAEAALKESSRFSGGTEARRSAIESAGRTLIVLRRYDDAARMLTEAAGHAPKPADLLTLADTIRRMRHYEDIPLPPADPASVAKKLFIAVLLGDTSSDAVLRPFLVERIPLDDDESGAESLRGFRAAMGKQLDDVPGAVLLDAILPVMTVAAEGSDKLGYRLRLGGYPGSSEMVLYVTREKRELKIAASDDMYAQVGAEAFARAEAGDLVGARQWLDWARETLLPSGGDDPLGGSPFPRMWTKGSQDGSARIRLAAAALACGIPSLAAVVEPVLRDTAAIRESGVSAEDLEIVSAFCELSQKKWDALAARTAKLLKTHPTSDRAFLFQSAALTRLARYDEAEKLANDRITRLPDDPIALQSLTMVRLAREDYAGVEKAGLALIAKGKATPVDYNNLAWNGLFTKVTDKSIEWAQKGAGSSEKRNASGLHTLAALHADLGHSVQAREALLESIDVRGREEPEPHDWYVFGRIAENYGEVETAREDYTRVTPSKDGIRGGSTYWLAQKRLASLGKAPAEPAVTTKAVSAPKTN